jgi:polysaccharide export outer membrane protein
VILPDGTISFPLAGVVAAAGKTTDEVAALLTERLTQFISDPEVNVRVQTIEGNIIYVTGEVAHPGSFVMNRPTDVMQAIGLAGGLTPFAKKNDVVVLRRAGGARKTFNFEYDDVKNGENLETNILLQGGDTVVVP